MTHPETPEVGGEATAPATNPFEDIAAEWAGEEQQEEPVEEGEPLEEAEDEPELEAEDDDLPPIDAPVSWDAEAKARFAELPRDLQETVKQRETERERFVQQKSQEAARARQEVEQTAFQQLAQYERQVAEELSQLAAQIGPQRPDPAVLQYDPQAFYKQQAAYENAQAQQLQLQRQAQEYAQQAQQREAEAERLYHSQQQQKLVEAFPEYLDPTSGPELQRNLSAVAREMGYSPELIAQARADDILAMKVAAGWKAKADKLDALEKRKMEKVRAARGLPKVATPGVAVNAEQTRRTRAQAAFETAKTSRHTQEKGDAFYEFLKNTGHL
jgi:hypothetical protein